MDATQDAAVLRTLKPMAAVEDEVRSAATGVTHATYDAFAAVTRQRAPPIFTSKSPTLEEKPSPWKRSSVPPATEPDEGEKSRMTGGVLTVPPGREGERPPAEAVVESVMACGAVESRYGSLQVSVTTVCISAVHDVTGQGFGVYELSSTAVSTSQARLPTWMAFSDGVSESVCPLTVSVSPSLPLEGLRESRFEHTLVSRLQQGARVWILKYTHETESSTGVSASE